MGRKETPTRKAKAARAASATSNKSSTSSSSSTSAVASRVARNARNKAASSTAYSPYLSFQAQLRSMGLTIRKVESDGNCLFRSLSDQLFGDTGGRHSEVRREVCEYLLAHPLDFEPFIVAASGEEHESSALSLEAYCARMRADGCWGGAAELCAASRRYGVHISIHQLAAPRLDNRYDPAAVTPDPNCRQSPIPLTSSTRTLHLSYHDGEHYNSVRNINDAHSLEPPTPIILQTAPLPLSSASSSSSSEPAPTREETIVLQTTPCTNLAKIRSLLRENWNDADAVVEIIFGEQAIGLDVNQIYNDGESQQMANGSNASVSTSAANSQSGKPANEPGPRKEDDDAKSAPVPASSASAPTESSAVSTAPPSKRPSSTAASTSALAPTANDTSAATPNVNSASPSTFATTATSSSSSASSSAGSGAVSTSSTSSSSSSAPASSTARTAASAARSRRPTGREKKAAQKMAKMLREKEKRTAAAMEEKQGNGSKAKKKNDANDIDEVAIHMAAVSI